jgi:hypothetical protein
MDDLLSALADRAGQTATIKYLRGGQVQSGAVTVGERP